jgi:nitrogen fixation/metabolism regulation signal transduction histidine kinase
VARRLAHEIKNPLTPIQLSAERMRRKFLDSMTPHDAEVLERATQTIVQQVESMKQMVNAFSEYARSPDMKAAPFALNALVGEVADLYRLQDPHIEVALDLDPAIETIEADRGRIRQILNNLITNALEAVESIPNGRIEISTRSEDSAGQRSAVLIVRDNGPGFSREVLAHVFDPYVTSKPKGTGLGLAIVKRIVEEHSGHIEARNGVDSGAQVKVTLPISGIVRAELRKERRA